MKKINIDPEHIAFLYEEMNMTVEQIEEYLNERGILISKFIVNSKLELYYEKQGRERPKKGLRRKIVTDEIKQKIVDLYCKGNTYKKIAEILYEEGTEISVNCVYKNAMRFPETLPMKIKRKRCYDVDIIRKIEALRSKGLSAREINEVLMQEGKI